MLGKLVELLKERRQLVLLVHRLLLLRRGHGPHAGARDGAFYPLCHAADLPLSDLACWLQPLYCTNSC
jgi:hypothetical protein